MILERSPDSEASRPQLLQKWSLITIFCHGECKQAAHLKFSLEFGHCSGWIKGLLTVLLTFSSFSATFFSCNTRCSCQEDQASALSAEEQKSIETLKAHWRFHRERYISDISRCGWREQIAGGALQEERGSFRLGTPAPKWIHQSMVGTCLKDNSALDTS